MDEQQLSPQDLILVGDLHKDIQLLEMKEQLALSQLEKGQLSFTNAVLKLYIKYGFSPETHQIDFNTGKFNLKE